MREHPSANPAILIVEDNAEDFEAARRALEGAGVTNPLVRCEDGDEALDYLHRRGPFAPPFEAQWPGLILLDLNLPGSDGREVLRELKGDAALQSIPVVVLTTSNDPRDVRTCYAAGASSYLQKPVDFAGFQRAMRTLSEYWFQVVILPLEGVA